MKQIVKEWHNYFFVFIFLFCHFLIAKHFCRQESTKMVLFTFVLIFLPNVSENISNKFKCIKEIHPEKINTLYPLAVTLFFTQMRLHIRIISYFFLKKSSLRLKDNRHRTNMIFFGRKF